MTFDASDRKQVRVREKEARQAEEARYAVVRGILGTGPGRAWMLERLESCHVFASSFSTDPFQMAFAEGQRNIGLQLLGDIMSACPERYIEMMQERNIRELAANARAERSRDNRRPWNGDAGPNEARDFDYSDHRDEVGNPRFEGYQDRD